MLSPYLLGEYCHLSYTLLRSKLSLVLGEINLTFCWDYLFFARPECPPSPLSMFQKQTLLFFYGWEISQQRWVMWNQVSHETSTTQEMKQQKARQAVMQQNQLYAAGTLPQNKVTPEASWDWFLFQFCVFTAFSLFAC